jgi:hypothetical protein
MVYELLLGMRCTRNLRVTYRKTPGITFHHNHGHGIVGCKMRVHCLELFLLSLETKSESRVLKVGVGEEVVSLVTVPVLPPYF